MAFLYISPNGTPWTKHSYSAGNLFDGCPYQYYLQKIMGWKEVEKKARFLFGQAIESAVQWHHEHDGQGAVQHFVAQWQKHADNAELQYTRVEKDWPTLFKTGVEMIKLYIIKQPSLPIPMGGRSLFQRPVEKEVFVGDPIYGGITDVGKIDIISYVEPDHPMLAPLKWMEQYGPYRPLIVDIKTSGTNYSEVYGMAAHDVQLRRYSWHTGIRDGALLAFVKKGHKLQKGSKVTMLEQAGPFVPGQEVVVALFDAESSTVLLLPNDSFFDEMDRVQGFTDGGKVSQTKEAKARRDEWVQKIGVRAPADAVTRQRLQFNAGFITIDSANDAGAIAGDQIIRIVNAWHRKSYPNTFGVRFPHDDRSNPFFRAFVLGDEEFKKANFKQVGEETIDDLFKIDEGDDDGDE